MAQTWNIGDLIIGSGQPLLLISGPCVIEDAETTFETAAFLKGLASSLGLSFIFKASYDKANRTSLQSFRGPGVAEGLAILRRIREELGIRVLSDVHRIEEIPEAGEVLDVIQIPAFLCRQTDLVVAAARTGKPINVKKGQFLAPWDVLHVAEKITSTGNRQILITERGTTFGYNNLVVDFRGIRIMREAGWPVVFDGTHSVQLPGGQGSCSGGQREFVPLLARAAVAAGADGIFLEVHKNPDKALCDGPNSMALDILQDFLVQLIAIREVLSSEIRGRRSEIRSQKLEHRTSNLEP